MGIISLAGTLSYGLELVMMPTESSGGGPRCWMGTMSRFVAVS